MQSCLIRFLTLVVIHRLALELFDNREAAGFALMLTIASPVIFANGISYYSMPAHLLANSVFALLLVRPTPRRAAAAGVVGSLALVLHNPVPHMLFAAPWFVWAGDTPGRLEVARSAGRGVPAAKRAARTRLVFVLGALYCARGFSLPYCLHPRIACIT